MDRVKAWLKKDGRSIGWLAAQCYVTASHMGAVLNMRKKLTPRLRDQLNRVTGLNLDSE